ncbi:rhomboid family intramembrane serine protease [Hydrogenophaga palleronii]|uniref:rhomboid family intramembrane serine protease n=1 Tax=Hydrogenophaga palleronii TaxID=65655 RepID=UPI000825A7D8|nr:rhomboid family intramembrane serine protease [Hydrogenophaga palleronii]
MSALVASSKRSSGDRPGGFMAWLARHSWLLLCALHALASLLVWTWRGGALDSLVWYATDWTTHAWTLWTSAWVHLNMAHLLSNLLALGALATLGWAVRPSLPCTLAWLLAWPLAQASLLLWPKVGYAVGLSGLMHAGTMVIAVQIALDRIPIRGARFWGGLLVMGASTKVLLEEGWSRPVVWDASNGMPVVQAGHLTGIVWGALLGLLVACLPTSASRPAARY